MESHLIQDNHYDNKHTLKCFISYLPLSFPKESQTFSGHLKVVRTIEREEWEKGILLDKRLLERGLTVICL